MTRAEFEKVHDDYRVFLPEWQFYIRSYLGGKFYRDGNYLLRHPFESEQNYKRRKEIAYYYNYCAPIVDIYTSYLSKKDPERTYGNLSTEAVPPRQPKTLFDSFWWDCDHEGTSFEQFMRDIHRYASIYGRVSVIVDKPNMTVGTKAQALAQDIRPYLTIVTPENLLDWSFTRLPNGKPVLDMIKVKEDKETYRIWHRYIWQLWKLPKDGGDPVLIDEGLHLDEIPIVNVYNKKSGTRMIGLSDLQDIADINKNIYYFCSDAKEIIENTAFPMLAVPYDQGGQSGTEDGKKEVGPKSILQFDPDKQSGAPFWLEPPHSSLAEIREWIQQDAQEMVRIAKMGGIRNTEVSVQPWSGSALEMQERQLYAALVEKAVNSEQAELDIFHLWCKWEGEGFTGNVKYPKDFALRDITTALQNAIAAGTTNISSLLFEKKRQEKIVLATLPELDEADRDKIFKEIDDNAKLPEGNVPPPGVNVRV